MKCNSPLGILIDWLRFVDVWRDQYQPAMEEVRTGRIPFSKLDKFQKGEKQHQGAIRQFPRSGCTDS